MSEFVRDERVAAILTERNCQRRSVFLTLVQLVKGRNFRTRWFVWQTRRIGCQLEADTPTVLVITSFSFSKTYPGANEKLTFLPYASLGFYSWQTNDDMNLQNDAYMYGVGADLKVSDWTISNSLSGYSGYKKERDKPMVYTFNLNRRLKNYSLRLQYLHGLRDWTYRTVKLSMIFDLKSSAKK